MGMVIERGFNNTVGKVNQARLDAGKPALWFGKGQRPAPKIQPQIPRDPAMPRRGRAGLVFDQFRRERMR